MRKLITVLTAALCLGSGASWYILQPQDSHLEIQASIVDVCAAPDVLTSQPLDAGPEEFKPLDMPETGYSGTASVRTDEPWQPSPGMPRWGEAASDSELPGVANELSRTTLYADVLHRIYQLGGKPEWIEVRDETDPLWAGYYETRFQREPERMAQLLKSTLQSAAGVTRQYIIFHMALALPKEISFPCLRELSAGSDTEDAEDALCALAFRGDENSGVAFLAMAQATAGVDCHFLADGYGAHDEFARQGKRDILRSYRCIELLDCRAYFHWFGWRYMRGSLSDFPWASRYATESAEARRILAAKLLPGWLAHYPGHPGSDDMAWRLALAGCRTGDWLDAAAWASRCATYPDQDMTAHGVGLLITLAECVLEPWQLDSLLGRTESQRNCELLQYIRLRRMACEVGFEQALEAAAFVAETEPDSRIAQGYAARWQTPVPKGLGSGMQPLPANDPLFRLQSQALAQSESFNPTTRWVNWSHMTTCGYNLSDAQRLDPPANAVRISAWAFAAQCRKWETLAELQRRCEAATSAALPDLRYKLGAVYYHNRDSMFPVYARHTIRSGLPGSDANGCDVTRSLPRDTLPACVIPTNNLEPWARSAKIFKELADSDPDWPGRCNSLFSAGLSYIKLANRETTHLDYAPLRTGVSCMESIAAEYPKDDLSVSASGAAAYWHRVFSQAWKDG